MKRLLAYAALFAATALLIIACDALMDRCWFLPWGM